jgi:hypothetical protein
MYDAGLIELSKLQFTGHILIVDKTANLVLADTLNQIHPENMSVAIALSLAQQQGGFIQQMAFGNGGSYVSGTGAITYFPPNVTNTEAELYNETYRKVVNNQSPLNTNVAANNFTINHLINTPYSDLVINCLLDYNEPAGQDAFDDASDVNGTYIFDELGLVSYNIDPAAGSLLTHAIFNPIQKSLNRQIEITYTLRISVG